MEWWTPSSTYGSLFHLGHLHSWHHASIWKQTAWENELKTTRPSGQPKHIDDPVVWEKCPTPHGEHAEAPDWSLMVPGAHKSHSVMPRAAKLPGEHDKQPSLVTCQSGTTWDNMGQLSQALRMLTCLDVLISCCLKKLMSLSNSLCIWTWIRPSNFQVPHSTCWALTGPICWDPPRSKVASTATAAHFLACVLGIKHNVDMYGRVMTCHMSMLWVFLLSFKDQILQFNCTRFGIQKVVQCQHLFEHDGMRHADSTHA